MVNDIAVQDFVNAIKEEPTDTNTTYNATVSRVDNEGVVWVNLYGSDKETPTASTSAEVKRGDNVNVNWRNNKLYISGNYSNPSAGIIRVANAEQNAARAFEAANNAEQDAARAHEAADRAEAEAERAYSEAERATGYANDSLAQLGVVEDVVGTLNWITTHATYKRTQDTEVHAGKWYFAKSGDNYNVVVNPTGNPAQQGWYEIDTIDEAVSNYVSSHLALTDAGLWVTKDGNGYKILLANDGMKVYDSAGHLVSTFGESITFDSARPQTIGNSSTYIKWYDSNNDHVADSIEIAGANVNIASSVTIGGMPTKVSDLTNDSGYQTGSEVSGAISTATSGLLSGVTTKDRYYLSTSSSSAAGGSWQDTVPTWSSGKYIWTRVATTKTTSSGSTTSYSTAVYDSALTKALSDANGAASTVTTTKQYYLSTSTSSATGGSWSGNVPTWSSGKYIWIRFKIDKTTVGGTTSTSYSPSENGQYDSALTTALSTASSAQSAANGAVASTVSCYYRSTTQSTPSISASTSIGTSANTDNAWEYVMPQPKRGCYFYTCEEYTPVSGTKTYSTVRPLDNATYTSKWCSSADNVYIDGGAIYANSVTADQIAANAVTADKIAANAITADKIKSNSIDASKLRIGDYNNYITANENDAESIKVAGNLSIVDGWLYKNNTESNAWLSAARSRWANVGDKYRITGTVKMANTGRVQILIYSRNTDESSINSNGTGWIAYNTATSELNINSIITIAHSSFANCAKCNVGIVLRDSSDNNCVGYFKNMKCERISDAQVGGTNILRRTENITISGSFWPDYGWYKSGTGTVTTGVSISDSPIPTITKAVQLTATTANTDIGFAQGGVPLHKGLVTQSVWAKGTAGDKIILQPVWANGDSAVTETGRMTFTIADGEWHRYTYTKEVQYDHPATSATSSATNLAANAGYVYLNTATVGHTLLVVGNKLEYGDKATEWTSGEDDYITTIDEAGIRIHPSNTLNNSVVINSDGMEIFKGGTTSAYSVAQYGDSARIGKENSEHVEIANSAISFYKNTQELTSISYDTQNNHSVLKIPDGTGEYGQYSGDSLKFANSFNGINEISYAYDPDDAHEALRIGNITAYEKNDGTSSAGLYLIEMRIDSSGRKGLYDSELETWLIYHNANDYAIIPQVGAKADSSGTAVYATSTGALRTHTSSSARYKKDIEPLKDAELKPENLYKVDVRQFKYREDYLNKDDQRYDKLIPGFIAEELERVYPIAVQYENGRAENWEGRYLIPPMLKLIQEQHEQIESLTKRIESLERNNK